jgi:hypothetical protein
VCANLGLAKNKTEADALEAVLMQWTKFEAWAGRQPANGIYRTDGSFDYVNYYKGSTINADLQSYGFVL